MLAELTQRLGEATASLQAPEEGLERGISETERSYGEGLEPAFRHDGVCASVQERRPLPRCSSDAIGGYPVTI